MKVTTYSAPPLDLGVIFPITSECALSRGLAVFVCLLWEALLLHLALDIMSHFSIPSFSVLIGGIFSIALVCKFPSQQKVEQCVLAQTKPKHFTEGTIHLHLDRLRRI